MSRSVAQEAPRVTVPFRPRASATTLALSIVSCALCVAILRYLGTMSTPVALGWGWVVFTSSLIALLLLRCVRFGTGCLLAQTIVVGAAPLFMLLGDGLAESLRQGGAAAGPWGLLIAGHLTAAWPVLRRNDWVIETTSATISVSAKSVTWIFGASSVLVLAFGAGGVFLANKAFAPTTRWGLLREDGTILMPPVLRALTRDAHGQFSAVDDRRRERRSASP